MTRWFNLVAMSLLFLISILIEIQESVIIFSSGVHYSFYAIIILISLMPIIEILFNRYLKTLRFYAISIFILALVLSILIDFEYFIGTALQIVALVMALKYAVENDRLKKYHFAYVVYGFLMLILSSLLRFLPSQNLPNILIFNIGDDINVSGVPAFFSNGIVIASFRYFVFSFSFQYMIIILILGFFLMENARGIIRISNLESRSQSNILNLTSMSFSVFSCQCETVTSIIPAIGAEILGLISIPIIIESLILSVGTFIYLHMVERGRDGIFGKMWNNNNHNMKVLVLAIIIMVASPIIISTGVYFNLQINLLFYFGTNIGLFAVSSFVFLNFFKVMGFQVRISALIYSVLSACILLLMVIWYFPFLLDRTVTNGLLFSLMGISSIVSGLILSVMIMPIDKRGRSVIYEYITGMFPIIFVVILYFTVITSSQIWNVFTITDQLEFALILLGVTLPFMWFATNYSIYGNYFMSKR